MEDTAGNAAMEGPSKDDSREQRNEAATSFVLTELDGLAPKDIYARGFILGYELSDVCNQILHGAAFTRRVRFENRKAIEQCCRDLDRKCTFAWLSGDRTESWLELRVEGK